MTTIEHGQKIRSWLNRLPGPVSAGTSTEAIRKAWALSGIACDVETFRLSIAAYGFVPDAVGRVYWLRFPGAAMKAPDNTTALRNFARRG